MTVWCNGTQIINVTGKDTGTANTQKIYFGYYDWTGVTGAIYFDDVVIDSSDYIGLGMPYEHSYGYGS